MDHENPAFGPLRSKYLAKETEAKESLTRAAPTTEYIDKYITGRSCLTPGASDDVLMRLCTPTKSDAEAI